MEHVRLAICFSSLIYLILQDLVRILGDDCRSKYNFQEKGKRQIYSPWLVKAVAYWSAKHLPEWQKGSDFVQDAWVVWRVNGGLESTLVVRQVCDCEWFVIIYKNIVCQEPIELFNQTTPAPQINTIPQFQDHLGSFQLFLHHILYKTKPNLYPKI